MFSRTTIRSTPSKRVARPGIDFTGRTQAKRSSAWRRSTLALWNPSPIGVVIGPFRATPCCGSTFSTPRGRAVPYLAIISAARLDRCQSIRTPAAATTRTAASVTSGPMPSPGSRDTRWWSGSTWPGPSPMVPRPSGSHRDEPRFGEPAVAIELLCLKLGMTRIFTENGRGHPRDRARCRPQTVVQKKTARARRLHALQLGFGERRRKRIGQGRCSATSRRQRSRRSGTCTRAG